MYEAFYGLSSKPFQLNPDPHFYFGSKQHRRAKAYLEYGVSRNDGFIVITGEIGAGKTMLLRGLLEGLARSNVVSGQLVTTQLDADDTLRMVGVAFGVRVKDVGKAELLSSLEAFLLSQTSQGKRCLLVIDEAQNLTPRALEELRMLSNFQLGNQSLLQSFLVGQPQFRDVLARAEMEQFTQRIAATCHIGPLDLAETEGYIQHRLKCAGATDRPTFDAAAYEAVHKASGGIPRRVNSICDRLLLLGFMENRTHLRLEDANEVVREFAEEASVPARAGRVNGTHVEVPADGATERPTARIELEPGVADAALRELSGVASQMQSDSLQRLERSLLRLERTNLQTLSLLQELVKAARKPPD